AAGFAAVGTLFSAMAANTRARDVLLPLLIFPISVPVVIASVEATALAFGADPNANRVSWLGLLVAFDLFFPILCFVLFDFVVEQYSMNARSLRRPAQGEGVRPGGMAWYDLALGVATLVSLLVGLYAAFVYAPTEAIQGDVQRIFYFHVPLAWLAYLAFFVVFAGSILYLWRRAERWDIYARCSAELGVVFTTLVLVTRSLWGRPIWGTWWSWDARMTSTLILWAIYVVYLMLRAYSNDRARGARYGAVLGILGFADVPIVQMSVVWWRTLHPGPVVSL